MPRAAFMTLGCKVNQFETETMEGLFRRAGYEIVPFESEAEVYVVNTCSVTSLGDKKSRQMIRRAARRSPRALVAVTGCYAQLSPEDAKNLPGVGLVIGTKDRGRIVELVERAMAEDETIMDVSAITREDVFEDIPLYSAPERTRAFLKIQDGCENFCSFCVIPYARGPLRSRPVESIRREAEKLSEAGFREIVLTGIHLGAYGRDLSDGTALEDAVREVLAAARIERLRLGSIESVELSSGLLSLLRDEPRLAKHLHLPLQSGSDSVLRRMNRHYNTGDFFRLVERARREVPEVAISTDIIVGFPGESDELFEESLAFASEVGFSRMHVFPYSPRRGTPAAGMDGQVPRAVKKARTQRMQRAADKMAADFHSSFLGKIEPVLFETEEDGVKDGLTGSYIRVYTDGGAMPGETTPVRLIRLYRDGIWGEVCKS